MVETLREYIARLGADMARVLVLVLLMLGVASIDAVFHFTEQYAFLTAGITSTSIVLGIAAISHIIRRLLFPNIDMREYAWKSLENPISAAIVYLGMCIVLSVFVIANIMLLS